MIIFKTGVWSFGMENFMHSSRDPADGSLAITFMLEGEDAAATHKWLSDRAHKLFDVDPAKGNGQPQDEPPTPTDPDPSSPDGGA